MPIDTSDFTFQGISMDSRRLKKTKWQIFEGDTPSLLTGKT